MTTTSQDVSIFSPRPYQKAAIDALCANPRYCLFLDMGLGKTVITLSAIARLLDFGVVRKALIVAPKAVAFNVWHAEGRKWGHLSPLIFSRVLGNETHRVKAATTPADVYVTSVDHLPWLIEWSKQNHVTWECVVFDELSKFRNWTSQRTKAGRIVSGLASWSWGLTGTPSPNGLYDLYSEISMIDRGQRLGATLTEFRNTFCVPDYVRNGVVCSYYVPREKAGVLLGRIRDITMVVKSDRAPEMELPPCRFESRAISMPRDLYDRYRDFKESQIMEISKTEAVVALNAATLIGKLQQFASGAMYTDSEARRYEIVHHLKEDALLQLLDEWAAEGYQRGVLIAYNFEHEKERLLHLLARRGAEVYKGPSQYERWNKGELPILIAHPASAGHGLNLQFGGSRVVWFGLTYDLELHDQFNKRVHRSGQTDPVRVVYLCVTNTIEPRILSALERKSDLQNSVLEELRHRSASLFAHEAAPDECSDEQTEQGK